MPDAPSNLLEWNEENFASVVSAIYRDAETDQSLHDKLMSDPFAVLSTRINVPEDCRGGIFARTRNQQMIVLFVPSYGVARAEMPQGTTEAEEQPDFEVVCTTSTIW